MSLLSFAKKKKVLNLSDAQQKYRDALKAERDGSLETAGQLFSELEIHAPDNAKILDGVGRYFYRMKDDDRAVNTLMRGLGCLNRKNICRTTLAAALARSGRHEERTSLLNEMRADRDLSPKDRMLLAEFLLKGTEERHAALAEFMTAIEEVKSPSQYDERYGRFLINLAVKQARTRKGENTASDWLKQGLALVENPGQFSVQIDKIQSCFEVSSEVDQAASAPIINSNDTDIIQRFVPAEFTNSEGKSDQEILKEALVTAKDPDRADVAEGQLHYLVSKGVSTDKANAALANVMTRRALDFDKNGDVVQAHSRFEYAIKISQGDWRYVSRYANYLVKSSNYKHAYDILKAVPENVLSHSSYHMILGPVLMKLGQYENARSSLMNVINDPEGKHVLAMYQLADIETALGEFGKAVDWLNKIDDHPTTKADGARSRRIELLELRQNNFSPEQKAELDVCKVFFEKNTPRLDEEQSRILEEIIDKGICMSDFDSLFGASHQDMWDAAEQHVKSFTDDPEVRDLEKRISECDDFNSHPEFSKMFKPSIVNYRMLKGEMYATEAAYQFYQHKRILDIANSYNEMLSKIRNVALWLNPPIGGKNIGERKGSQIWHRDQEDENILKCFIYYTDVEDGCGPTEYILESKVKPRRKYSDVLAYPATSGYPGSFLIDEHINKTDMVAATGRKKSIMFFDTNGFHRGGYVTKSRRILTMATFLRPVTPYAKTNTKLSMDNWTQEGRSFEAEYGLKA